MKTPRFWYSAAAPSALAPFAALYGLGAQLRRCLTKPYKPQKRVICIGNLVAGGAGKTPTVLALLDHFHHEGHAPHVVLRGYGGQQKAPLRIDAAHHTARDVGDEALLLAPHAPTWVGSDRVATIKAAEREADLILMDDGFQNPTLQPTCALLVIDGATGLGNGALLPAGPLREKLETALPRADAVILIGEDKTNLLPRLEGKPVLRAHIEAHLPSDFPRQANFIAFSGIARPEKFFDTARATGLTLLKTHSFADHHAFSRDELESLWEEAESQNAQLLTTSKDARRLPALFRARTAVLPITLVFDNLSLINSVLSKAFLLRN